MSRTSNQLYKSHQRVAREVHDNIVQELLKDPSLLNVAGLDNNSVVWKESEFHYMHGRGHQDESRYERFSAPDLVFFYYNGAFRFLVTEAKSSMIGRSALESAPLQLDRARSYFKGFWKGEVVNRIKPSLIQRFGNLPSTDVFLSLVEVTRNFGSAHYDVYPFDTDIYLGRLSVSAERGRVYFERENF